MENESHLHDPLPDSKFFKPNLSHPTSINADSINLSRTFNTTSTFTSTASSSSSSPPDLVRRVQAAFKRHRPLGVSNGIKPRRCLVSQRETSKDSDVKPHSALDAKSNKEDIPQGHRLRVSTSHSKSMVSVTRENQEDASITPPSEWCSTVNTLEENFKTFNAQRDQTGLSARSGGNSKVASSAVEPAEVKKKVQFATENNATSRGTEWDVSSFLQNDLGNAITQSSVIESSCVTSTLIDSTSAPMISSTTYFSQPQTSTETAGEVLSHQSAVTSQAILELSKSSGPSKEQKDNVIDTKSQPPSSKVSPSDANLENSKSEKIEKDVSGKTASKSRKKGYDSELFFKVNGKLYQRLGKIGSGGSSEVHKVISSDCKIYALKKIKLEGRDYATAYGFCQEINSLNTLKGKSNIRILHLPNR